MKSAQAGMTPSDRVYSGGGVVTPSRRTALYDEHLALGGRMVDFSGFSMPLQYSGIIEEHRAVRERAGLFDVSHMGELDIEGADSAALVDRLVTGKAGALSVDQAMYTFMCYPDGGVVDDLLVYRLGEQSFRLVVNAANEAKDEAWVREHAQDADVSIENASPRIALLALQGPRAEAILDRLTDVPLDEIRPFRFRQGCRVDGAEALVSRTGYTGEDGFELYVPADQVAALWRALLSAGEGEGLLPCGLGARDSLRFEARLPLYGQELSSEINPLEAGLSMFVKFDKPEFVGKSALETARDEGVKRKIVGFEMVGRGNPRHGYPVGQDGKVLGHVTSGMFAPTLGAPVGLALLPAELAHPGETVFCRIRGRDVEARTIKTPFYRRERT